MTTQNDFLNDNIVLTIDHKKQCDKLAESNHEQWCMMQIKEDWFLVKYEKIGVRKNN